MSTVDDVTTFAKSLIGLSADPASARANYIALIAPGETSQRAAEMAIMSGCALVQRGILRRFILHPILEAPYRTGHAMSYLEQIANEARAHLRTDAPLFAGCIVIVGGGSDGGGPEHTWYATDVDGENVCAVDGGQVVDRYQCVLRREHTVTDGWDVTATYRRRVRAVIDVGAVLGKFGR